ncbi:MAG: hypothetical protein RBT41_11960 [Clostridia bacterium]|nr:hypothetical protein [Clostridia bacterium]
MKKFSWQIYFGAFLIILSTILYVFTFWILQDTDAILKHFLNDIAFIPIDVLVVSMILHQVLAKREKANMLKKLNMVIGTFFSEVGRELLKKFVEADTETTTLQDTLSLSFDWGAKDFKQAAAIILKYDHTLEISPRQIQEIKEYLHLKRDFLLRLLENPNLLENESFSDLLWAVFHLTDELGARDEVRMEEKADYYHIVADLQRAYRLLTAEWIYYMKHLREDYPYLYSFAIRTNPFNPDISVKCIEEAKS